MAKELNTFYVVRLREHWWLMKHYQCFLSRKQSRTYFGLGTENSQAGAVLWWKGSLGIISSWKGKESLRTLGYLVSLEEGILSELFLKCSLFPSKTTES